MPNLNATLDNLIAMVIVLLALSLVVQAVQSAVKKAFKLKSRQIEDSLAHLFQFVLDNKTVAQISTPGTDTLAGGNATVIFGKVKDFFNRFRQTPDKEKPHSLWANKWKGINAMLAQSPFLRIFLRWLPHPAEHGSEDAAALYNEVVNKFRGIGRMALSTRPIFDSLSKSDLLRVVGSVNPNKIDSSFGDKVEDALAEFERFFGVFQAWADWLQKEDFKNAAGFLTDDDKAKLADARSKLKPLLDDLRLLLTKATDRPAGTDIETLVNDVAKLRAINLADLQTVLDDLRAGVLRSAERARLDNKPDVAEALDGLSNELVKLSEGFAAFRQRYDAVFAKWVKLENSFDIVMQSFEERYSRSMKTAALIISFLVVVLLNANFFSVYRQIATSDATRDMILQSRADVINAINKNAPNNNEQVAKTVDEWFNASKKQIADSASTFEGYGFEPVKWSDAYAWFGTLFDKNDWFTHRKQDLKNLLGWIVMALLLSVGAPFWQDFLESLFGVKNVLRKKSDTQNVEDTPGAGQPKQS